MQLDVLSLDVSISRSSGNEAYAFIKAKVVPTEHETIRLGSKHVFAEYNFKSALERIDADLWIVSGTGDLAEIKALFPEKLQQENDPAGYASAVIPATGTEPAILSFTLIADEARLTSLLAQVDNVAAGSVTISLWIDGLKFGFPDEDIWEARDSDHARQFLPVRSYSIEVAKLRTTRGAISDARQTNLNAELADSDDADERKRAKEWIREASRDAAEQSVDPALGVLRQCRALLAFLLIFTVVAIVQRL